MNNPDLRLRLKPYRDATGQELRFINTVFDTLVDETCTGHPVQLSFIEIDVDKYPEDDTAFVDFHADEFEVVIDPRLPIGMVVDYLIHEISHIGTWFVNEEDDHGPMFGVEYARLYRRYLEIYAEFWETE